MDHVLGTRKRRPLTRWASLLLAAWATVGVSGCRKWVLIADSPVRAVDGLQQEEDLLVRTRSGDRLELFPPIEIIADSLSGRGRRVADGHEHPSHMRVVLALRDIEEIRVDRADDVATSLLVAGAVVGSFVGLSYLITRDRDY